MEEQILVPMDDSPQAEAALEYALDAFPEASITALHVVRLPEGYWSAFAESDADLPGYEAAHDRARELLDEAVRTAAAADREIDAAVKTGKPAREIVRYATEGEFDGIVIGSHGRKGVSRILLGSVSEAVVRRAPMTVVVVRQ